MNKWIKRGLITLVVLSLMLVSVIYIYWLFPFWGIPFNNSRHTQVPLTPAWALECWVWEDDVNTSEEVLSLLKGYKEHDFPVRTILIDSPWSKHYNDFDVDEERYPDPEKFFGDLQEDGYRVVLWMTPFVNSMSKDTSMGEDPSWYTEAEGNGYLTGGGDQIKWWKGKGGLVDYTNPDAMKWWRDQQQPVFDWGIDGWKLDGAATFFTSTVVGKIPVAYRNTAQGMMTTRGYMDHYYRDEYQHGLTQNPEFITLSRSQDNQNSIVGHPEGFAPLDASPVNWVGDQDHEWSVEKEGLGEALRDILKSAEMGYNIIGSDIGGYSGGEIPPRLYIRWAQFSTFCGLFLNGGHGERAMWKRTDEELTVIRKFSWLHTELLPYIYTYMVECHEGGKPLMRPSGVENEYFFGDEIYVAPIYKDSLTRTVHLPKGQWRYFFGSDSEIIEGPTEITRDYPMDEFPVYVRNEAIIPMRVSRDYTGFGTKETGDYLTLVIYPGAHESFTVHRENKDDIVIALQKKPGATQVILPESDEQCLVRMMNVEKPETVTWNGEEQSRAIAWNYESETKTLVIRQNTVEAGTLLITH